MSLPCAFDTAVKQGLGTMCFGARVVKWKRCNTLGSAESIPR